MAKVKEELLTIIRDVVKNVVINNDEDYDRPLREIGIDSLDMMSILLALEEKYNVSVPDEDMDQLKTINLIVAYAESKLSHRAL
jgi:acyl carrier protein